MLNIPTRIVASLLLALSSLAYGQDNPASRLPLINVDRTLKNGVFVRSCAGESTCEAQEVRIYRQSAEGFQAFEILYRDAGRLVQDGSLYFWQQGDHRVTIGSTGDEGTFLCSGVYQEMCDLNISVKHPDDNAGNTAESIFLVEFSLSLDRRLAADGPGAKTSLLPYIVPSPNQEDAGSCHYMAGAGAMEILWNQSKVLRGLESDSSLNGSSDLSEAFLMNIPEANSDSLTGLQKILGFQNNKSLGMLNADFPFWNSANGGKARDNWKRPPVSPANEPLPSFKIENIHGSISIADNSKWAVTVLDDSDIERVKEELKKDRPVLATYNHYGYWHVVIIVGFDDSLAQSCSWTQNFIDRQGSGSAFASYQAQVKAAFEADGGCQSQGAFYVRDSLGFAGSGDRAQPYNRRGYDWLKYLGNHIYSVGLQGKLSVF